MKGNSSISWAFVPNFPFFRADFSPGREFLDISALLRLKQHAQNLNIVRHHGAPDILPEARPTLAVKALQTKGPFQPGNIGFQDSPKVAHFLVNPQALDHRQNSLALPLDQHNLAQF